MKRIHTLKETREDGSLLTYCGRAFRPMMLASKMMAALPATRRGCRKCFAGWNAQADASFHTMFPRYGRRPKRPPIDGHEIGRAVLGGEQ